MLPYLIFADNSIQPTGTTYDRMLHLQYSLTYKQWIFVVSIQARWLQDQGIKPGGRRVIERKKPWECIHLNALCLEVVCMMQQNHPMFFVSMYGIAKTGAIASLINTNLSESSLMHCLKVANTRLFLFDPIYEAQVATVAEEARAQGTQLFAFGDATEDSEFTFSLAPAVTPSVLQKYSADGLNEDILSKAKGTDAAILIYTRFVIFRNQVCTVYLHLTMYLVVRLVCQR